MSVANLEIKTGKNKEVVDITQKIAEKLTIKSGLINVFVLHTTCSVCIAELDPGTDQDYLDAIEEIAPKIKYRHAHNPQHAPDHIMSSMVGASLTVPVENGNLVLGTWQSIVLIELNGPKPRKIYLTELAVD